MVSVWVQSKDKVPQARLFGFVAQETLKSREVLGLYRKRG
jgi:hypothetical protein